MWTQFKKTLLVTTGTTSIVLQGTPTDLNLQAGMWVVVTPYGNKCEIRKVTSATVSGTNTIVTLSVGINSSNHVTNDWVFIQTSPVWDILLFGTKPNDGSTTYPTLNYNVFKMASLSKAKC